MHTKTALAGCTALLLLVTLGAAPLEAGDWDFEHWTKRMSAWAGHGVGSMVHRRTTTNISHPQMPAPMKTVTEEKKTLVKITETHYVLKVENLAMGQWTTREEQVPKTARATSEAKVEDVGEGSVTIEGKAYACKKKKYTGLQMDGGASAEEMPVSSGVVWVHDSLGVLRIDSTTDMMGQSVTTTWQVQRLDVSHQVGDTTLACREIALSNPMMGGKMTLLECPSVPGDTVRLEMKSDRMGATTSTVTELVAYVKK